MLLALTRENKVCIITSSGPIRTLCWNLHKSASRYAQCVCRIRLLFFFSCWLPLSLIDCNVISVYRWATLYFIHFMSNIILRNLCGEPRTQVLGSIKETLFFFLYGVITDVSCISIFYSFLPSLVCHAFRSIATFIRVLSFIDPFNFSFYRITYVAQRLVDNGYIKYIRRF